MSKICVTTSDKYHHLIPVFLYLYKKYWNEPFDLVGYDKPECELPDNCTWVSLGKQGDKTEFSADKRKYFESLKEDWVCWMMEDTILKAPVDDIQAYAMMLPDVGRIDLTGDVMKREHTVTAGGVIYAHPNSRYRLSTQPSVWNKEFLLKYLTPGMDPWTFETQDPKDDGYNVVGFVDYPLKHNEGIRRFDLYKLNLDGVAQEDIDHIKTIAPWVK